MTRFILLLALPFLSISQNNTVAFLPEIVKQFPNVRDLAISPNGEEILFSVQSFMGNISALVSLKKDGNDWSEPKLVPFSGQFFDIEPFFSKDGLKLYYASNRPLIKTINETKDFDIWYVARKTLDAPWSEPINMGSPINSVNDEFYPSLSENGNLYITVDNKALNRKDDIYVSELINGTYTRPKALSENINSEGYEFNAFIAPDESYILYTCYNRKDGLGSGDLYISHKTDTDWTPAKNVGEIVNTDKMEYCPFVDPKNKTLYFTSKRDNTKTAFETPLSIDLLKKEFFKYDNGLSRLYSVSLDSVLQK